ncbi:phosphodiester glycosidase family protein [Gelidibacter gilvus]|uniref:Metallophosphoesterase n=1 Tax=Gelidibacter gilvus TaxID=59602 RepID=A0A4Q0XG40_9FLAO|nr:phosphodiester glycosidase family protein [Gelidibacter gilvus]RXJ50224.1 hypothetical protein ESZ48_09600 [Gelidibacter gilvus]
MYKQTAMHQTNAFPQLMNASKLMVILLSFFWSGLLQAQEIHLNWKPRQDLNTELPASIKLFDTYSQLPDGAPLRAMYAEIDLRDTNLKFRSIGSDAIRETTTETYQNNNAILAINGGYFASDHSVSLIIEDGAVVSKGSHKTPRGAFGIANGKPEVTWTLPAPNGNFALQLNDLKQKGAGTPWLASQAIGGGPVLVKNGEILLDASAEGFGTGHAIRHPRSAIGYKDEHTLVFLVVDGRQEASAGATLQELAQIMHQLGAVAAVNLDGGGSSALIAANEVVNVPANVDGGDRNTLRKNAGALIISEKVASKKEQPIYFDTEDGSYSEIGIWKDSKLFNYYGKSASRVAIANPMNKAYYRFNGIRPQAYQLGAWFIPDTQENSTDVQYILHRSGKTDTLNVDQSHLENLGKWTVLGEFQLQPEDFLEIRSTSGNQFISDAIRLLPSAEIPEVGKRGDMRIAVISDLNSGLGAINYEWQVDSIVQRIPRIWKPDLVISGGDLVAGMGVSDPEHLQKMWDVFSAHIVEPLNRNGIPFAFTLGNHDGPRSYKIEHDFTRTYWNESANKPDLNFVDDSHFPNYYSFVQDDIFFVSWEASSSVITEENLKWMDEQFQLPVAKNARFRFVMGHMPLYSVAQERDSKGDVLEHPEKLRALLERYKVHTYVSGHQHAFYPGKRGKLQLLNTGAAGSGPRSWLSQEWPPTNTITIMDLFYDSGDILYTTYEIKEKKASDMKVFDIHKLPSAMFGVNGHQLRSDREKFKDGKGSFNAFDQGANTGDFTASIVGDELKISGNFALPTPAKDRDITVGLFSGRNSETGKLIQELKKGKIKNGIGEFSGTLNVTDELEDLLAIGAVYIKVATKNDSLRGQLYPSHNTPPQPPTITSHLPKNTYGVRNLKVLNTLSWTPATDVDGDFVTYTYQIASDPEFSKVIFQQETGRSSTLKFEERDWFLLLKDLKVGDTQTFYHRVLATDGSHLVSSERLELNLLKSDEALTDLAEVNPPNFKFKGKIEASGGGYGALWDDEHKIWLADYSRGLIIKNADGLNAAFSPLTSVEIEGKTYPLRPVNGIGKDLDGNILAGINRHLIKIDAKTGKGIAVWEVPQGNRAITSPRAARDGTIFAMSLFGNDGNFILKQNGSGFDLLKTISLEDRILSRTFNMSADGRTLYFPDPGTAITQVYHSDDGESYKLAAPIRSLNAGSSALQVQDHALYFAVRSSGISPSSFHYRNSEKKEMWTLELPEVQGAEPRGIGVSPDGKSLIFCSFDQGGGYYLYELVE